MTMGQFVKVSILLTGVLLLFFANPFSKFDKKKSEITAAKVNTENLLSHIQKHQDLILLLNNELREKGFPSTVDFALLPNENIELIIKPTTKEITKDTVTAIQEITAEIFKRNNLSAESFELTIIDYYTSPTNTSNSVRLSYMDLMGYITENLAKEKYGFALDYESSETQTIIHLTLSQKDFGDENTKSKIKKIVRNTMQEKNFNSDSFQINLTTFEN